MSSKYQELLAEIQEIAINCGRNPKEITLVAVTKNHSWEEAQKLYDDGCRIFAENRVQEALPKMEEAPSDIEWHLIGTLQKKKVTKIAGRFALIHSVDNFALAQKLSDVGSAEILLQVNASGEESKHGFTPEEVLSQFEAIDQLPNIEVKGLMTMAPLTENREVIRKTFRELRELRDTLPRRLEHLSMGMSSDYREAIEEGATLLRVGTILF